MKKVLFTALLTSLLAIFANAQSVSGSIGNGTVTKGGSTRGTIVLSIPGGLHVNSNRPNSEFAIPTTVKLTAVGAKVSAVSYPRGARKTFSFSDKPISVYDGRATFGFNVNVPASFKGSVVKVRAVVRYQACTDEVCYPPKSQEITLSAKVK